MNEDRMRSVEAIRRSAVIAAGMLFAAVAALVLISHSREAVLREKVRDQIVATIQREARASFLVTGTLDITATITHQSTRTLLPGIVNLDLGTSSATIQVPGRAFYGVDARTFKPANIAFRGDTVQITLPRIEVLSVEPNLAELRTWTSKGWLRTPTSVREAQNAALHNVNAALMRQARSHIATSQQPSINTADALEAMLRPTLVASGLKQPHFEFELGNRLVLE
jgi:hypothetical protein